MKSATKMTHNLNPRDKEGKNKTNKNLLVHFIVYIDSN